MFPVPEEAQSSYQYGKKGYYSWSRPLASANATPKRLFLNKHLSCVTNLSSLTIHQSDKRSFLDKRSFERKLIILFHARPTNLFSFLKTRPKLSPFSTSDKPCCRQGSFFSCGVISAFSQLGECCLMRKSKDFIWIGS